MKTPKRSNEEIVKEFDDKCFKHRNKGGFVMEGTSNIGTGSQKHWLRTILTEKDVEVEKARTSLHTSLVAAVEGLEITSKPELKFVNPHIKTGEDGYNFALEEVLTIINSIFKE